MDFREEAKEAEVLSAGGGSEVLSAVVEAGAVLIYGHGTCLTLVIQPETDSRDSAEAADVPETGVGGVGSLHRPGLWADHGCLSPKRWLVHHECRGPGSRGLPEGL